MSEDWREALHADLAAGRRRKRASRLYDASQWKARRTALKENACCCLCIRFGIYEPATVADHVVPAADSDFAGELQPLCGLCHRLKRLIESRWRKGTLGITELNMSISKEGARLRANAFGVGVDGFALCPWRNNGDSV
jgi:hypothetical protein